MQWTHLIEKESLPNDGDENFWTNTYKEGTHRSNLEALGMLLGQLTIFLHLKHDFLRI
jgi:hypothetical protein